MLFYFGIIIIVLNLIFGVIIDTFADLRNEKQKKDDIIRNTCFICGLERRSFDNRSISFETHIQVSFEVNTVCTPFLHGFWSSEKAKEKETLTDFGKKMTKTLDYVLFIWMIFPQNREIFAYFFFQIFNVFNNQKSTHLEFDRKLVR